MGKDSRGQNRAGGWVLRVLEATGFYQHEKDPGGSKHRNNLLLKFIEKTDFNNKTWTVWEKKTSPQEYSKHLYHAEDIPEVRERVFEQMEIHFSILDKKFQHYKQINVP